MRVVALAALVGAGGCDLAFGLTGDPGPCAPASFATVMPRDLAAAEVASVSWDRTRAVIATGGIPFELALPGGTPHPIELGVYPYASVALAPEGTSLFLTAAVEPPLLEGALRASDDAWTMASRVPLGTYAGTPSADEFGPRRALVRLRASAFDVQEYEDADGTWKPHGDVHAIATERAPNLTPNGLSMVYLGADPVTQEAAVLLATRASVDEWFGEPVAILPGAHATPQLLDNCRALYTVDDSATLREYDLP